MGATDLPGETPSADEAALRRALFAVKDLRTRLEAAERARFEPIAIVGLGCHFPGGADGPEQFWELLRSGGTGVTTVPRDRWDIDAYYDPDPDAPGKMSSRWGGFLSGVDRFDAAFFGISPREAVSIDPQQRLLLEVAWHALEDAGLSPDRLFGASAGVFVGISTFDYAALLSRPGDSTWIESHTSLGNAGSVAAGRIAYSLGLTGPCMSVDTACSSSLVAVHLAAQSLRSGECSVALAAGVNLILSPELSINFSRARMLAADGRCKTFDAAADGYVRGEGCGVVVLKTLSAAQKDGDRVLAVIRGSAVNQDGRSSGLTAPNGPAQEALIRRALETARLDAADVSYVEAHGTGTALGDPIEVRALTRAYSGRDESRPFHLGSVKTNIGHLESAAGIAGLIKTVLALQHREIPPHLHFRELNPHIELGGFPLRIPTAPVAWETGGRPRIAGVSSFGFSGTNAHLLIEEAPAAEPEPASPDGPDRSAQLLCLSARSGRALEQLAGEYRALLRSRPPQSFPDLCHTANTGRAHLPYRLAVTAATADEAAKELEARAAGAAAPHRDTPRVAFLFTGQGAQYPGMARELYETEPRFRAVLDRCAAALDGRLPVPLLSLLAENDERLHETRFAQPALFALELALAELWRAWGVEPEAVIGHSLGEYVAACVAGVFDLEEGIRLVAERGRLMQELPPHGAMAAAFAEADRVREVLERTAERQVQLAALNSPANTVITGERAAVERVLTLLRREGIESQPLQVSHAFHSRLLDPMLDRFERAAGEITYREARIPVVSNLTALPTRRFDAAYWRQHASESVRFMDGVRELARRECDTFLEIGPQPVLCRLGAQSVEGGTWIASLRRGVDDWRTLLQGLGTLFERGAALDLAALDSGRPRRKVSLPLYPFERARYWPEAARPVSAAAVHGGHPLLGRRIDSALPEALFEGRLDTDALPFLADHVVFDQVLVPGASHLVMGLLAAGECAGPGAHALKDVVFAAPLIVPEEGRAVQLIYRPADAGGSFELFSKEPDGEWVRHASGTVTAAAPPAPRSLEAIRARCQADPDGPAALRRLLDSGGIHLGPSFHGIHALWRGDREALVEIRVPETIAAETESYPIHPAILDACFQAFGAAHAGSEMEASFLPLMVDRLSFYARPGKAFWCHVRVRSTEGSGEIATGDLTLLTAEGAVLAEVEGLHLKRTSREALAGSSSFTEWLYAPGWHPAGGAPLPPAAALSEAVAPLVPRLREELDLARLMPLGPELEVLATDFAVQAFRELGIEPGRELDLADVESRLGIAPRHQDLFRRLCGFLEEDGLLEPRGPESWVATTGLGPRDPHRRLQELRERFPECAVEIELVGRCGAGLARVLRGEQDPLPLLFPPEEQGSVYRDAPFARLLNGIIEATFRRALESLPPDGRLRVLEVGAGTGGTTASVLPLLPPERTEYVFTDVSPAFLAQAQRQFSLYPFVTFQRLDLERAPEEQGFEAGGFDLVLASNVLHATADLRSSLAHVRRLLRPGGLLLAVEGVKPRRWSDLVFGLTEGWWRFSDRTLRAGHPLLRLEQWLPLLRECGYAAAAVSDAPDDPEQAILVASAEPAVAEGRWLVIAGSDPAARVFTSRLTETGAGCRVLAPAEAPPEALEQEIGAGTLAGVVDFRALDDTDPERLAAGALELAQAMLRGGASRLWLVTRGAQPAADSLPAPGGAALWGLGKVLALEHPELQCVRVDLDPSAVDDAQAAALLREIGTDDRDVEVAYRGGLRHAARLERVPAAEVRETAFRADATYLITGASGGLGLPLARWLAERGARSLALVSRRAPAAEVLAGIAELREEWGCDVEQFEADVASREALQEVLQRIDTAMLPLRGVFHLAGSLQDRVVLQQDGESLRAVFAPKVDGATHLHELTLTRELDHFVLFSTSASLLGYSGQANHAAANAYLDALAHYRRGLGLPGLSVNWGAWAEIGAVAERRVESRMQRQGVGLIPPEAGFAALGHLMEGELPQAAVIPIHWQRFLSGYPAGNFPPFYSVLAPVGPASRAPAGAAPVLNIEELRARSPEARRGSLASFVHGVTSAVLGLDRRQTIDAEQPLSELGLDSLMALDLRNALGKAIGIELPATLLFNYPTLAALTDHLENDLLGFAASGAVERPEIEAADLSEIEGFTDEAAQLLIENELKALIDDL
ncbi:MAG: type I polyketide synthase [Armatimonadota bacterium]